MPHVGAAAVWNPSPDALAEIRKTCGQADAGHIGRCFLDQMKAAGASAEAQAFTAGLASSMGLVYVRAFRPAERVDIAYIEYAFRANELEGVLLVNGTPSPIDVDDDSYVNDTELRKDPNYAALAQQYPNISVWPGNRFDTKLPKVTATGWGTQAFLVQYLLRDGCHACAEIGKAMLAFNFDTQGNFQGVSVSSVIPAAPRSASQEVTDFDVASGVAEIRVLTGKQFSITLLANHTTGYSWRLAGALDPKALKLVSNEYEAAPGGDLGASGEEVWTFSTATAGTVQLVFEYVRPFEKDAKPVKTARYSVIIE